jgi:predicted membrane metal-binding protein
MSYTVQWNDYRMRRRIFWIICISYLPGVFLLSLPLEKYFHSDVPMMVIAFSWLFAFLASGWYMNVWICPCCGNPYFKRRWFYNQFTSKCVHCGLKKWADKR